MTKPKPSVQPSFCVEATNVTIAKPNKPIAEGSAVEIFTSFVEFKTYSPIS